MHGKVVETRSIDLQISFVVIHLGVTGLKKSGFMCFLDLFGGKEGESLV